MNKYGKWPHWLPKGTRIQIKLTKEQHDYILPVYTTCRERGKEGTEIDGVLLCDGYVSGIRCAFKEWLRRFEFSDIDVKNIEEVIGTN